MGNMKVELQKLSSWTGTVAWITVISGVISAVIGLFAFVVGSIPGIITIIMGMKLFNAREHARAASVAEENETELTGMIKDLSIYFKIQAICAVIGVVLSFFAIILGMMLSAGAAISGLT
jgi:hypothetical protein